MRKMATMLLAAAVAVACSDSDSVAAPDSGAFDGVYTMQAVNGQKLPYVIYQQDSTTVTVLDGHLDVGADGTWTEVVNLRMASGADTVTQAANGAGAWYRAGSSLLFTYGPDNSTYYSGTLSENRLDLYADVVTVVYTK